MQTMQTNESLQVPQPDVPAGLTHHLIASDRIEGTEIHRSNGQRIGTIQRLMIDKLSGNVAYAVMAFGGFLGIGQKHLPVPWSSLKYNPSFGAYVLDLTDDEFRRAPSYEADSEFGWGDRSQ